MSEFQTVLNAVLPIFCVIVAGFFLRRLSWLTTEADNSLLRLNINLLFPCLILDAALGNPALSVWQNLLVAPLVGFGTIAIGMAAAWVVGGLLRFDEPRQRGTFAVTVGMYNYGYVPLPLAILLYGSGTVGVLFVHNVGVEAAMWTLGVILFSGTRSRPDWKQIINAPLIAIVAALLLNGLNAQAHIPSFVRITMHWLGQSAIPMALILIGAVVGDHFGDFHSSKGWRVIGAAVLLRVCLLPVVFLVLAKWLPASVELKRVMVLEAAMPSAVFPIVMARHYGGDPATALRVVVGTSLASLITTPLWIRFGVGFVGL
jgi:predicted permease